jgi:acyl-CoA synthetase (AMP-forming)/AMP-acid ligase II
MTNLSLYLTESADMYPGAAAVRCERATMTYSELADLAARFAAYLFEQDVRPGDRVGSCWGTGRSSQRCSTASCTREPLWCT